MNKRFANKDTGLIVATDFKTTKARVVYWVMFAFLIAASIVCLFPVVWVFMSAFKDLDEFLSVPPTIIPKTFNIKKLPEVWKLLNFQRYYLNSIWLVIGDCLFAVLFNGMFGYVLSRLKPKGVNLVFTAVFWTMLMPSTTNMIPLFMTFVNFPIVHLNLTDTYLPMWMIAGANAYFTLLFRSAFNNISMTYVEAARMDGCTNAGIFFKIMVPLCIPTVFVVLIFSVQQAWGAFLWPYLVLKDTEMFPISLKLFELKNSGVASDIYFVAILLAIIPPAILYCFFSKYIMGGANVSGGIKG